MTTLTNASALAEIDLNPPNIRDVVTEFCVRLNSCKYSLEMLSRPANVVLDGSKNEPFL